MRRFRTAALALATAVVLSGCYESDAPLIAAGGGDFPFAAHLRYAAFEWNADIRQWQDSEGGITLRAGDHYVQTPDGSMPGDATPFVLKSIGGGFYIGQEEGDGHYAYDLLKIDGDTVYEYAVPCDEAARRFQAQGLIDMIAMEGLLGNVCTVSSFEKLARVFRDGAESRQPKAKFVIAR